MTSSALDEAGRRSSVPLHEAIACAKDGRGSKDDGVLARATVQQINEPSAILEFAVSGGGGAKTVRCEADRQMVASVLEGLEAIQAKIDQLQA